MKELLLALMGRILKKEILESFSTFEKLCNIDPTEKKNQNDCMHVDVGFAARDFLQKVTKNKLRVSCMSYLLKIIALDSKSYLKIWNF